MRPGAYLGFQREVTARPPEASRAVAGLAERVGWPLCKLLLPPWPGSGLARPSPGAPRAGSVAPRARGASYNS